MFSLILLASHAIISPIPQHQHKILTSSQVAKKNSAGGERERERESDGIFTMNYSKLVLLDVFVDGRFQQEIIHTLNRLVFIKM